MIVDSCSSGVTNDSHENRNLRRGVSEATPTGCRRLLRRSSRPGRGRCPLISRGDHLDVIQRDSLRVRSDRGDFDVDVTAELDNGEEHAAEIGQDHVWWRRLHLLDHRGTRRYRAPGGPTSFTFGELDGTRNDRVEGLLEWCNRAEEMVQTSRMRFGRISGSKLPSSVHTRR